MSQLDLVLALTWVKENAAEFGADPSRSAHLRSVGRRSEVCAALMATPVAEGTVPSRNDDEWPADQGRIDRGCLRAAAATVLQTMGAGGLKGKELVAKLNSLSMEQIQEGARSVSGDWLPVVDNVILSRNPFDPDAPALSEMVPMMLGNVHDETAVSGPRNGEITWDNAAAVLDTAVHEYLGPVKAEERRGGVSANPSGLHAAPGRHRGSDSVPRLARSALGGRAAGGESRRPASHLGVPDELPGCERKGDAHHRHSVHVRQHRLCRRPDWNRPAACGRCEYAGGDHVADADHLWADRGTRTAI